MPIVIGVVVLAIIGAGAAFFLSSDNMSEPEVVEVVSEEVVEMEDMEETEVMVEDDEEDSEESSDDDEIMPDSTEEIRPEDITTETEDEEEEPVEETSSLFEDGTYNADASYFTPRRVEHDMVITLEVESDVIVDANITYDGGPAGTPNHTRFDDAYTAEVIGVRLDEVSLARTGGASLTSEAFNEAVEIIKADATS